MLCREEEQSFKSLNCSRMAGRVEGGAWRGHTSLICLLLRLFSQINAVVCLQMKRDFLGMLLNPFTIARENATCKPCMKRERLDHFCSDISAASAVTVLKRLGKKSSGLSE